jgi:CubicO group peptidase (beta-lactamase class C family)
MDYMFIFGASTFYIMKKIILLATFCFIGFAANAQQLNTAKLDSLFTRLSEKNQSMGSFAIAKDGKVIYSRAIGFANEHQGIMEGSNTNTLYRIGSTTKMFTAAMIYQLVDEGKLSLDTKLSKYFPVVPNAKDITVLMLLNHTNGLQDFVNDDGNDFDMSWITQPRSDKELMSMFMDKAPHFAPGASQSYSNTGYLLLTHIIEKVTGKSYNENLQKRMCSKLGLKNTYSPVDNNLKKGEAASFSYSGKWERITDIYFPNVVGVGDILSTPSDLIAFNEALVAGKLFSEKSMATMKTFTGNSGFGAGIMRVPFYDKTGLGHGGDTYGTHTLVATFPEDKLTIAFSVNGEVYPHNDVAVAMLSIVYGKKFNIPEFNAFAVSADLLDKYAGTYSSPQLPIKLLISRKNEILVAQASGQPSFPLEAIAANAFKFDGAGVVIEFEADKNQLVLKQGGGEFTMSKE